MKKVMEKIINIGEIAPYATVGQSTTRVDAIAKVSGKAIFSTDMVFPGMLYGKILFSDRPHAEILTIDTRAARALPGVRAVITAADAPDKTYGIYIHDKRVFAKERVLYAGQPVAAVAAESEEIAYQATKLIRVVYQDLPAVFSMKDALAEDAFPIHPALQSYHKNFPYNQYGNVFMDARIEQGSPAGAFAEADVVLEETYTLPGVHQAPLEPHACTAHYDVNGRITIWTSTQMLSVNHNEVAQALDLPMTQVRIIPTWMGGGFGGKLNSMYEPICALLTMHSGKPVRLTLTRKEESISTHPRAPFEIKVKIGATNAGKILAIDVDVLADSGAFSDEVVMTTTDAINHAQGAYKIPNCLARARGIYTNNINFGCMRGFGVAQMHFALESHIDVVAHAIGMNPAEFRLLNLVEEGDQLVTTQKLRSVHIRETMEAALEASNYYRKKEHKGKNYGIGIANVIKSVGFLSSSAAVRINEDATATIMTGITDIGTGTHTVLCQIAAEVLGIPVEDVHVASPDSDSSPYDIGSFASRTTYDSGNAVRMAAENVREQLITLAASLWGCSPADVIVENGHAVHQDDSEKQLSLAQLVGSALYHMQGALIGYATQMGIPGFSEQVGDGYAGHPFPTFAFATHIAEVEVNPDTGQVKILNFTAAHDVGKVLNPAGIEGQVTGGVAQGIGMGLFEEIIIADGFVKNPSFVDYLLPTVGDIPPIDALFIEREDPTGPFGAKGIGEHPVIGPPPAIANAIFDATGVRMRTIPITAERLFIAMHSIYE